MATNPQSPPSPRKNRLDVYSRYSGMGIQMLVIIFAGTYCGIKLDEFLSLKFPAFTIMLSLLSVAVAIWFVVKDLIRKK
ncbi:MAG TPA: AtpZ/AtpI family protein [Bacteroidia bacterium]|nr:AtpZ/AtpI family protein [Bacteroidia bacterium]